MEDLVLRVGSVSGRSVHKFPATAAAAALSQNNSNNSIINNNPLNHEDTTPTTGASTPEEEVVVVAPVSKRQRKKMQRQQQLQQDGIPGLKAVPVGGHHCNDDDNDADELFCIEGTVAHLVCRVTSMTTTTTTKRLEGSDDDDGANCINHDDDSQEDHHHHHWLITAQVDRAYVLSSYWDADRNLFRPGSPDTPPYLTFFGSQTFGYVVTEDRLLLA